MCPSPISQKNVPDFPTIIGSLNQTPILNTYYNFEDHWLKQSMVFNTFLEEPSMATLEQKIIDELKLALEYQEPTGDYAQWLMGISLPSVIERKNNQLVITARVVVKTSDSEYVDGMDIAFSLEPIIDPNYYQNSPITQGDGSVVHFTGRKRLGNLSGKVFAGRFGFQLLSVSNQLRQFLPS